MLLRISYIIAISCTLCFLCRAQVNEKENEVNVEQTELEVKVISTPENCKTRSNKGDRLYVHYNGTLENGNEFDKNNDEENPFSFTLGVGQVIKGWDEGLTSMCMGEVRRLKIPPHLAYGEKGVGVNIPPNATLYFDVKLIFLHEPLDLEKLYKRLDSNSDNFISGDEMAVQIKNDIKHNEGDLSKVNEIVAEIMQVQDLDKDGVLSKDEFMKQPTHDEL